MQHHIKSWKVGILIIVVAIVVASIVLGTLYFFKQKDVKEEQEKKAKETEENKKNKELIKKEIPHTDGTEYNLDGTLQGSKPEDKGFSPGQEETKMLLNWNFKNENDIYPEETKDYI